MTGTTGRGSIISRPSPTPLSWCESVSSSSSARSIDDGRRLSSTGLFEYERMERGERERERLEFQVRERAKAAPRREDCGEAETELAAEEKVESAEAWVVGARRGVLKVVERDWRRVENGEGNGAGILFMVIGEVSSRAVSRFS